MSIPLALWALVLATGVLGQTPGQLFNWGFTTILTSTDLPNCTPLELGMWNQSGSPTPPFYMLAFPVGGIPSSTYVGTSTNGSGLSWTMDYPAGTQLILAMVDSQGMSGGVDVPLYTVIAGNDTSCVPTSQPTDFVVSANVTTSLDTCAPWGISVTGGTKPYTVSIAALNTAYISNSTLGPDDDHFTYINRILPNGQMVAAVSDATGRWATGTPLVHTAGDASIGCGSLASSSSSSTSQPFPGLSPEAKTAAIAGATAGVVLILCALAFWFWRRSQRKAEKKAQSALETGLDPFVAPPTPGWLGHDRESVGYLTPGGGSAAPSLHNMRLSTPSGVTPYPGPPSRSDSLALTSTSGYSSDLATATRSNSTTFLNPTSGQRLTGKALIIERERMERELAERQRMAVGTALSTEEHPPAGHGPIRAVDAGPVEFPPPYVPSH